MDSSRLGCPDRYDDFVSKEISCAVVDLSRERAIAVVLGTRFLCSPRGLAQALATGPLGAFSATLRAAKCGLAYSEARRAGPSKKQLAADIPRLAETLANGAPWSSWEAVEDMIATRLRRKRRYRTTCVESPGPGPSAAEPRSAFCARQAAADLCRLPGAPFCGGLDARRCPQLCRLGLGARKGVPPRTACGRRGLGGAY